MKLYKNLCNILLILFIILFPILPSYGAVNSDIILYLLILLNVIGFIFLKEERNDVLSNIKIILKDKIFLSLIFLNLTMYMSTFIAINKRMTFTNSIRFSLYVFVFYLISYTVKNKKQISIVLYAFIFTAVLSSLVGIYQIIQVSLIGNSVDEAHRVSSFLENSNGLGAYALLSFFIVIMFILKCDKKLTKVFYSFLSLLLLVNIIASQSRNALIGLFLGSLLVAILYDKRFIIISFVLPVILFIIPQSRVRIVQIFDPAQNISRFKIWEAAKMMIKDNPFFGIGYENFQVNYPIYVSNNRDALMVWDGYRPLHPHNVFLKIQCELGVIGTFAFILFLATTIFTLVKLINKHTDKKITYILIGITSAFVALQFMNLLDNFYSSLKVMLSMMVILGIANYYRISFYNREDSKYY